MTGFGGWVGHDIQANIPSTKILNAGIISKRKKKQFRAEILDSVMVFLAGVITFLNVGIIIVTHGKRYSVETSVWPGHTHCSMMYAWQYRYAAYTFDRMAAPRNIWCQNWGHSNRVPRIFIKREIQMVVFQDLLKQTIPLDISTNLRIMLLTKILIDKNM